MRYSVHSKGYCHDDCVSVWVQQLFQGLLFCFMDGWTSAYLNLKSGTLRIFRPLRTIARDCRYVCPWVQKNIPYVNDCGVESCEQLPPHRMFVVRSLNIAAMTRSLITTQTTCVANLSSLVSVTMDIIAVAGSSVVQIQ
eukprot:gb/GECG01006745.1/.p1 GENE.gb/GECG01006745.1/~~gb/GECG01006745.1/.p1  ORF type:complete len:139 (+),score=1.95 gb/GECG01006745.1/:1-417(+)